MKKTKKVVKKKSKNLIKKIRGRVASDKSKDSKVKKLIRLSKMRTKKGESKSSSKGLGHFLKRLHKSIK